MKPNPFTISAAILFARDADKDGAFVTEEDVARMHTCAVDLVDRAFGDVPETFDMETVTQARRVRAEHTYKYLLNAFIHNRMLATTWRSLAEGPVVPAQHDARNIRPE